MRKDAWRPGNTEPSYSEQAAESQVCRRMQLLPAGSRKGSRFKKAVQNQGAMVKGPDRQQMALR